jgi:cysteinyl-tRNA synthetase
MRLLRSSSDNLKKLFQQINNAYIQMVLADYQYKKQNFKLDDDFIKDLDEDLDFVNAISTIYSQTKSLSKLIRNKEFDKVNYVVDSIDEELKILGLKYENPIGDNRISSIVSE